MGILVAKHNARRWVLALIKPDVSFCENSLHLLSFLKKLAPHHALDGYVAHE